MIHHKISKVYLLPMALIFLFLAVKIPLMNAPFVNLESYYALTANMVNSGDLDQAIGIYQRINAVNPLFSVIGITASIRMFGYNIIATRLFSLICAILLAATSFIYLKKYYGMKNALVTVAFILFNPLFYYYSFTTYTDIPFMFYSGTSIMLLIFGLRQSKMMYVYLSAVMMILSGAMKIHIFIILLLALIIIMSYLKNKPLRNIVMFKYAAIVMLPLSVYYFAMISLMGKAVLSASSKAYYFDWLSNLLLFIPRIGSNIMFVGIFISPIMILMVLNKRFWQKVSIKIMATILCISVVLSFYILYVFKRNVSIFGEMKLDLLINVFSINAWLVISFAILCALGFLYLGFLHIKENKTDAYLLWWILLGLIIGAVTRPADRYLLVIMLPIYILLFNIYSDYFYNKYSVAALSGAFLLFFVASNIFSSVFYAEGIAAQRVAEYVNKNNIKLYYKPGSSDSDSVLCHNWYLIRSDLLIDNDKDVHHRLNTFYINDTGHFIHQEKVKLFGFGIKKYIIALRQ